MARHKGYSMTELVINHPQQYYSHSCKYHKQTTPQVRVAPKPIILSVLPFLPRHQSLTPSSIERSTGGRAVVARPQLYYFSLLLLLLLLFL
jgi:hypothetical protein